MTSADIWLLVTAAACVVLAGGFSAADAALASFSRARAQELVAEGRPGARRLVTLLDDAPRYLNTALLMRLLCEIAAIVIVTQLVRDAYDGAFWRSLVTSIGVMALVSFVVDRRRPANPRPPALPARRAGHGRADLVDHLDPGPDPAAADPDRQRDHARAAASARGRSRPRPSCASWSTSPRRRR